MVSARVDTAMQVVETVVEYLAEVASVDVVGRSPFT